MKRYDMFLRENIQCSSRLKNTLNKISMCYIAMKHSLFKSSVIYNRFSYKTAL